MGKKQAKKVNHNGTGSTGTTANNHSVKANEQLLKETIQSLINNPEAKNNLIEVAISSKNTRILELFAKNGGKLTTKEFLEKFEYILGNDRVDILKYFIEESKLNLNKLFKFEGGTVEQNVIHIAAKYGANKCIEYLLKKKYNINQLDSEGCVPLQYAMTSKGLETPKLFIQKGAKIYEGVICSLSVVYKHAEAINLLDTISNLGVKFTSYETYKQVTNNLNPKSLETNSDKKKLLFNEFSKKLTSFAEKTKLKDNYYKLILGHEYHLLPKVIEEQKEFINDKILQLNSTTNYDIETKEALLNTISLAINIYNIFIFNERAALENYIVETLEQNKHLSIMFLERSLMFCLNLAIGNYKQNNYSKSIKYAEIIEGNLSKIESCSQEIQLNIFNTLAGVYANSDPSKALNYLSKVELLKPHDNSIIETKYNIYLNKLDKLDAAIVEAEKITDNDIKALLKINAFKKSFPIQNITAFNDLLLQYNFNKLPFDKFKNDPLKSYMYYDIQAQQNINSGQNQKACKIYDKLLNQAAMMDHNIWFFDVMYSYLLLFARQKDFTNGCKFLDKIHNQYPKILVNCNDLKLKMLEFLFYNLNDQYLNKGNKILVDIKPTVLIDKKWVEFIVEAYNSKFYQAIFNQKVKETLPIYIQNIEKLFEDSLNNPEIPAETREQLLHLIDRGSFIQSILSFIDSTPKETEIIETQEEQPTPTVSPPKMIYEPFVRSVPEAPRDMDSFKKNRSNNKCRRSCRSYSA